MTEIVDNSGIEFLYQHHWLVAAEVITKDNMNVVKADKFNILYMTKTQVITAADLDAIQKRFCHRYATEIPARKGQPKIVDVFIQSISHLGLMNAVEFNDLSRTGQAVSPEMVKVH